MKIRSLSVSSYRNYQARTQDITGLKPAEGVGQISCIYQCLLLCVWICICIYIISWYPGVGKFVEKFFGIHHWLQISWVKHWHSNCSSVSLQIWDFVVVQHRRFLQKYIYLSIVKETYQLHNLLTYYSYLAFLHWTFFLLFFSHWTFQTLIGSSKLIQHTY